VPAAEREIMTMRHLMMLPVLLMGLSGCAETSPTTQRVGGGAAVPRCRGWRLGGRCHRVPLRQCRRGALIGAGVGATGGFLYDQSQRSREEAYQRGVQSGRSSTH
jgi:hypothetical protein